MSTKVRMYGEDTPFGDWLRSNRRIPSNSLDCGVVASDVDMTVMRYKRKETGKVIQSIMQVEVKTRMSECDFAQSCIMSSLSAFSGVRSFRDRTLINYGVCFIHMSGTSPLDSDVIRWRRFPWFKHDKKKEFGAAEMRDTAINVSTLESILRFDLHPISLKPYRPEFSHHGHRLITVKETTPLGFVTEKTIRKMY